MKHRHTLIIFILLILQMTNGIPASSQKSGEKRKAWIDETFRMLKEFSPSQETKAANFIILGTKKQRYHVLDSGLISFPDGSWMYIVIHSGHNDEDIGDVILGRDNKGNIYHCNAHVCGGLMITLEPGQTFDRLETLLLTPVDDKICWKKVRKASQLYTMPPGH